MLTIKDVKGAIFDLDDTLLDNGPLDQPSKNLHSRSRIAAVHEIGQKYNIEPLISFTDEENAHAFTNAVEHSAMGAIFNIFYITGLAKSKKVERTGDLYNLAQEIVACKHVLHEPIIHEFGVEVPGAVEFVWSLEAANLKNKLAIATSAIHRDVEIFLQKYNLTDKFLQNKIISHEDVARPKPDPQCFDLAFKSLDLPDSARQSVLAFEDNPRGITSAKAAGLYVCAITTRYARESAEMKAAKPDLIADSYTEFRELLQMV